MEHHGKSVHPVCYDRDRQLIPWLRDRFPAQDWSMVAERLPPIVWRSRWNRLADMHGLPFSRGHMANLDAQGIGPASYGRNNTEENENDKSNNE